MGEARVGMYSAQFQALGEKISDSSGFPAEGWGVGVEVEGGGALKSATVLSPPWSKEGGLGGKCNTHQ